MVRTEKEKKHLREFGLWLSKRRIECGFESQNQLHIKSTVSTSTLCRIEAGTQKAEPETLAKLAPHLKMSHGELMIVAGYLEPVEASKKEREAHVDDAAASRTKDDLSPRTYEIIQEAVEYALKKYGKMETVTDGTLDKNSPTTKDNN